MPRIARAASVMHDCAASCNCYKVRLLMAHLGVAYERVPVDIFNGDTLSDDYARMNPMRTTRVLEADGRHLPESNAILFYLAKGTEYLPGDVFELAQVVRWLIYEQTDVVPMIGGLRFRLLAGRWSPEDPDAVRRRKEAEEVFALLDAHLAAHARLRSPGEIAEISMSTDLPSSVFAPLASHAQDGAW
jgi:glutathione S-transferase